MPGAVGIELFNVGITRKPETKRREAVENSEKGKALVVHRRKPKFLPTAYEEVRHGASYKTWLVISFLDRGSWSAAGFFRPFVPKDPHLHGITFWELVGKATA